ncbi:Putative Two-component sensor histidine kinase [Hyphomicrobium sp. GJ21]|uniref:sensor histidine kinase n=1 Tax=Hyphomicrobium sp. GJ21 TaxID=113574 RepID=UPI000622B72F|nr:HAMP domain-containing sensor histidine kinase [Hyphomicrobium sp. GJ21]CEJ87725.1 Putative Two-component sensor histidine kinase [Hyphomicrobium sp. GJ21]
MSFGSLRLRLLLAGAVSISIALGIAGFGLTELFRRHVERRVDSELNVYLNQLVSGIARTPAGGLAVAHRPPDPRFEVPLSGLYWQIDATPGGKVLRSRSLWDNVLDLPAETSIDDEVHRREIVGPHRAKLYLLQRYIELPAELGGERVLIAVALQAEEVRNSIRNFAIDLLPFLLLIGALLAAAFWLQVSVGLRPLAAIRGKLSSIRTGTAQRLGNGFPDEVQPLAAEIDDLLDARDLAIEKAKGRAADLAHGLKTPLQVLNVEIDRLKSKGETEIASDIASLAEAMRRHVDHELARARIAYAAKDASTDVTSVIDRVVRVAERTPQGQKVVWQKDTPRTLMASIHGDDLAEVLGNLTENAARHARKQVSISARAANGAVVVTVADDGPGIAEEHQADAMVRGRSLDTRKNGTGLGLAIVTDILEAWHGSLTLDNGAPGLIATVRLRAA